MKRQGECERTVDYELKDMRHLFIAIVLLVYYTTTFVIGDNDDPTKENLCESLEILRFEDLHWLDNCTVIDGNLVIIFPMVHNYSFNVSTLKYRSFAKLREVTGFIYLHLGEYVTNLQTLFPNLTIIRGSRLFLNYAFVIYECEALEEMTLRNLLRINRGSFKISGNFPKLCYPQKIDFNKIILNGQIILPNNETTLNYKNCTIGSFNCDSCPNGNCWHNGACQRFKETSYNVKNKSSQPCHEMCLGPCVNKTASGCYTCEDISQEGACVKFCSEERVLNTASRRCITKADCRIKGRKIYKTECLSECPKNYSEMYDENTKEKICLPCVNDCVKSCIFPEIMSIQHLEKAGTACTIIKGDLKIRFIENVNNLTSELKKYLGDVEEIHGNLIIYRSTPITSLTFLNNLQRVYGNKNNTLQSSKSMQNISVYIDRDCFDHQPRSRLIPVFETPIVQIHDNENLQSFFDFDTRIMNGIKLDITRGSVLIHNNSMLCNNEIEKFKQLIEPYNCEERKYDNIGNNGNLIACNNPNIKTYHTELSYDKVKICWEGSIVKKNNYSKVLQYLSIDDYELTESDMLYKRSFCSACSWTNLKIPFEEISQKLLNGKKQECYKLNGLDQYTLYAYTIKLDDSEIDSGVTNFSTNTSLQYCNYSGTENIDLYRSTSAVNKFRTFMEIPSRVTYFSTHLKTPTSIMLEWDVKTKERDAIKQFFINIYEKSKYFETLELRDDYCEFPSYVDDINQRNYNETENNLTSKSTDNDKCCLKCCEEIEEGEQHEEKEEEDKYDDYDDDFRDSLIKLARKKSKSKLEPKHKKMKKIAGFLESIRIEGDQRSVNISDLKVYTFYMFHIYACTEDVNRCSEYEVHHDSTLLEEKYDQIDLIFEGNQFLRGLFKVYFAEPKDKNGPILNYLIEIRDETETGDESFIKYDCITKKKHESNKYFYTFPYLNEGEYNIRVGAISAARRGPFTTWHSFKIIHPTENYPIGFILTAISFFFIITIGISLVYYYRYKIYLVIHRFRREPHDEAILLRDMETQNCNDEHILYNPIERLFDIQEEDDEQ
ncbi:hypothetical protein PVAND_004432 [Polypedilum vanderplanki]|uniref:receptor protein-tyrosine kinase n=1 Tax=Polypedilum vanderplanki TaxID=319348 RepID=A0A9J6BZ40_POLVA|nr:hypothetical protein PVAND_004432 [Polypedilum vanderplanki]